MVLSRKKSKMRVGKKSKSKCSKKEGSKSKWSKKEGIKKEKSVENERVKCRVVLAPLDVNLAEEERVKEAREAEDRYWLKKDKERRAREAKEKGIERIEIKNTEFVDVVRQEENTSEMKKKEKEGENEYEEASKEGLTFN